MSDPSGTSPTYGSVPNPDGTPTPSTTAVPPATPVPASTPPPSYPPTSPAAGSGYPADTGGYSAGSPESGSQRSGSDDSGKVDAAKEKASEAAATAKDEAASVLEDATSSASQVAGTAKDEAAKVVSTAKDQTSALLHEATSNLRSQSSTGKDRAAVGIRGVSAELASLADGSEDQGVVADLARQAGHRLGGVAEWLEGRDVDGVLQDVQTFARRRPLAFIAIAVGAGVVAGRLTRALKDAPSTPSGGSSTVGSTSTTDAAPDSAPAVAPAPGRHSASGSTLAGLPDDVDPAPVLDSGDAWGTPPVTRGTGPGTDLGTDPGRTERA
jgi:hypothetical protein